MFYQHLIFFYKSHFISSNRHRGASLCREGGTYKGYGAFLWNQLKGRHVAKLHKGSRPRKSYKKLRDIFSLSQLFSAYLYHCFGFLHINFFCYLLKSGKCPLSAYLILVLAFVVAIVVICFPPIYPSHSNIV